MNVLGHYFIFQIKKDDEKAQKGLFMDSEWHGRHNMPITVANYDLVYGGAYTKGMVLSGIFHRFNMQRPAEFKGHSLSISDVIVTVVGEEIRTFFVDSIGFTELSSCTFFEAWDARDIELAFQVGDRYLYLQTSSEGGYDYDLLSSREEILDGGIYDDENASALVAANEIIMDSFKKELPKYNEPDFNPVAYVIKGHVVAMDDLIPCCCSDFYERDYNKDISNKPDVLYRAMILEQFRNKNKACYEKWKRGYFPEDMEAEALAHVEECFKDTGLSVKEVVFVGSRARCLNRADSDYDFLVEYTGDMKEDAVFNLLNQDGRKHEGIDMDFNPIREDESGPLVEHLLRADAYLELKGNTYYCVHWYMKNNPEEKHFAYCRAFNEVDALKIAASVLDLHKVMITDVTEAQKHQITRQSITFNCNDVILELEKNAVFG